LLLIAHVCAFAFQSPASTFDSKLSSSALHDDDSIASTSRRSFNLLPIIAASGAVGLGSNPSEASVGSLPELQDTNAYLQCIKVQVADLSQQEAMISFLTEGFDCKILRKRIRGTVEETWLGFGPEKPNVPSGWLPGVSSLAEYGGHASIAVVYDSSIRSALYRLGDSAPGDNVAYLQLAVPGYRISRMVAAGGNILDAYGHVDVVSPSGLPIRGIVGIAPDPIMLVAINCVDVKASKAFYEQLGFVEADVPYARPSRGTTAFEPAPPAKSVYMAPSRVGMGVLLIPVERRRKSVSINPSIGGLTIVYAPSTSDGTDSAEAVPRLTDPSGLGISFQTLASFEEEEKATR
jgi:hypothetical protein